MRGAKRCCDMLGLLAGALVMVVLLNLPRPYLPWNTRLVAAAPTREKVVALTFDDGPHPKFTPEILTILDRYRARATFFMIGEQMAKYPRLVREVRARGHAIGNHTFTHPQDLRACTPEQVAQELDRCDREIRALTGERCRLFRPPRGRIDAAIFAIAEDRGYQVVDWTISADHRAAVTPKAMAARVLRLVSPGAIILAHDGTIPSRAKDVQATELIVRGLARRGYRLVTVPELLASYDVRAFRRSAADRAGEVCAEAVL